MKSITQLHDTIDKWWEAGMVGNLIIYRAPGSATADCIIERVIKAREMPDRARQAFEAFMDDLQIDRGEVVRDAHGRPDRVKLTRRFDG